MKSSYKYALTLFAMIAAGGAGCDNQSASQENSDSTEQIKDCEIDGTCTEEPQEQKDCEKDGTCTEEPQENQDCKKDGTCTEEPQEQKDCEKDGTCTEEPQENQDCPDACTIGEKACSGSNVIVSCQKALDACPDWVTETICEPGSHCDETTLECSNTCTEICSEENQTKCTEYGVFECRTDVMGCAVWEKTGYCQEGTYCDTETGKCIKECPEPCDSASSPKCTENGIEICENDENGCGTYHVEFCEPGTYCDEKTIACIPCQEICNPDALRRCSAGGIETCTSDMNGCAEWILTETCSANQFCDKAKIQCVAGCKNACTAGSKQCSGSGISECKDANGDGCTEWVPFKTCGTNQSCDPQKLLCVDGCKNACKAGTKKCIGDEISTCKDLNGDGCTEWGKAESCPRTRVCYDKTLTCECYNTCKEVGLRKCIDNYVYQCSLNESGCREWLKTNEKDCKPFSIILIPDTQNYTKDITTKTVSDQQKESNIYTRQMKWIKDNETKENIRAAIHLGDITNYNVDREWQIADYAHKTYLDKSTVPYTISAGDHDYLYFYEEMNDSKHPDVMEYSSIKNSCHSEVGGICSRERTKFNKYFGKERFKNKSWYHDSPYPSNSYITFSVGALKFLILTLENAPRQDVICWANARIKEHPDHHVIIATHKYIDTGAGKLNSSSFFGKHGYCNGAEIDLCEHGLSGFDLFHALVARHNNIFMVVSGHANDSEWRSKKAYNGNTVTEMLVDYQFEAPCKETSYTQCTNHCTHARKGGNGWLRQLIFDPMTNKIQAKTITVLKDSEFAGNTPKFYCSDLNNKKVFYSSNPKSVDHNFSFTNDFTTPVNYKYSTGSYLGFGFRDINPQIETCETGRGDFNSVNNTCQSNDPKNCSTQQRYCNRGVESCGQLNPAVAVHRTSGMFAAVWEDDTSCSDGKNGSKTNHDIAGRIFYAGGCQKIARFTVNAEGKGDQKTPAVAMDSKGNFVVVWASDIDGDGNYDIMMRGFDENGKERIKETHVNTTTAGQQSNPTIAMAANGRFVVAWEDESGGASKPQIFMRGFDANGKETFEAGNINTFMGSRRKPSAAMADNGNFVITWEDDEDMNGWSQVLVKGFNADGSERFKSYTVNSISDGNQRNPTVAMNRDGYFYIAYEDDSDENNLFSIKARGFEANGKPLKDYVISDNNDNDSASNPAICVTSNKDVIIVWESEVHKSHNGLGEQNCNIRHRSYKASTGKFGTVHTINPIENGREKRPAMSCTQNGNSAILWQQDMFYKNYYNVYGIGINEI